SLHRDVRELLKGYGIHESLREAKCGWIKRAGHIVVCEPSEAVAEAHHGVAAEHIYIVDGDNGCRPKQRAAAGIGRSPEEDSFRLPRVIVSKSACQGVLAGKLVVHFDCELIGPVNQTGIGGPIVT